jgi:WD40 repeat protein
MGLKRDDRDFNPFPGLRPFSPDESELFFGREEPTRAILVKLLNNRFVNVIGAAGCGKSSIVYCGVLPEVTILDEKDFFQWRIISFRPGHNPFGNLADAILKVKSSLGFNDPDRNKIISGLINYDGGLSSGIKRYFPDYKERVLLIIDQFEDIFRYAAFEKPEPPGATIEKFVELLVDSVSSSEKNVYTVVVMRSEFISECANYQGLTQFINSSVYFVPNMGPEHCRNAIEGPVKYAKAKIDPVLVEKILDDTGDRSDQLPVFQHTMMSTWASWKLLEEPERPLSLSDYEAAGSMKDAISKYADEVYNGLDTRSREICEILFKAITEKGSDGNGLRHPAIARKIKAVAGCSDQELIHVIDKFRTPSVPFILPGGDAVLTDESVIDLSHECILLNWERLKIWIDEESDSSRMYLKLSGESAMFQQGKAGLLKPPDLQLAINWRDRYKPNLRWAERYDPAFERALVYLRTSEKAFNEAEEKRIRLQMRRIQRAKIITMFTGLAAMVAVIFMLFAYVQKMSAKRQAILAEIGRKKAEQDRTKADSVALVAILKQLDADSAANAARQKETEAIRQSELAVAQKAIAEQNALKAEHRQRLALVQYDSAKLAGIKAGQNAAAAIRERDIAMRQRMLSVSKAMALKSLQLSGQKDIQTLLAYQAYLFNRKNNGPDSDADIYAGLYDVARLYGNTNYKSFFGQKGEIKSIAFVPGKNEFFTSGSDGQVLKWSLESRNQTLQVVYSGTDIIDVLAVSPDESWLACGSSNSAIRMIPLRGNETGYEMKGHNDRIRSLIFSFDGKYLYSAALDGKVMKWDLSARTGINVADGTMQITSIDISSNGNFLAGISKDGSVIVWDPERRSDNFRIETRDKNVRVAKFNPENNLLALGDENGNLELWDISRRMRVSEVKAHSSRINDIKFNSVLNQMATAGNDKTIKLFNIADPADLTEPPITLADNEGFVLVMQFSPDGQLIVSGAYEGKQNIVSRPTNTGAMVGDICKLVSRNMTQAEWNNYVGKDIPMERTCPDKSFNINISPVGSVIKGDANMELVSVILIPY